MKPYLAVALAALSLTFLSEAAQAKAVRHRQISNSRVINPYGGYGSGTNRFPTTYNVGGIQGTGPILRDGRYLGQDPDPNVRAQIIRDQGRFRR